MTRDQLIKLVDSMRAMIEKRVLSSPQIEPGVRFVVVATSREGQWVAVSSNVDGRDTQAILRAALVEGRRKHTITTTGEETDV